MGTETDVDLEVPEKAVVAPSKLGLGPQPLHKRLLATTAYRASCRNDGRESWVRDGMWCSFETTVSVDCSVGNGVIEMEYPLTTSPHDPAESN